MLRDRVSYVAVPKIVSRSLLTIVLLMAVGSVAVHAREPVRHPVGQPDKNTPALQDAPQTGQTGQIGCVDMDRVYVASGGPEQLAQQANEIGMEVTQHLKEIKSAPMLSQEELQEYGSLVFKNRRTEAEQARIKAIKQLSDQRTDELNRLQVKPDKQLTAEDKARMKALQEQSRLVESILPFWQEDAHAQQNSRVEAYRRVQIARLRTIVGKVATERNIAHVFDTSALVYSTNDITTLVVARVSKHSGKDDVKKDDSK